MSENSKDKNEYENSGESDEELDLPLLDFSTIVDATESFSTKKKIGEGGFGPVYKVIQHLSTRAKTLSKVLNFRIYRHAYKCEYVGETSTWAGNCCEKTFKKLGTRNNGVQK